jgi:hypothetical protein
LLDQAVVSATSFVTRCLMVTSSMPGQPLDKVGREVGNIILHCLSSRVERRHSSKVSLRNHVGVLFPCAAGQGS